MTTRTNHLLLSALAIILCTSPLFGEVRVYTVHGVERLPNGNTLVTDGGGAAAGGSRVLEVAADGSLRAAWLADLDWAHDAELTGSSTLLVTDTGNDRVVELDSSGTVLWDSADHAPFSDGSTLAYPNDADLLASGNLLVTDRDHHRVLEIDRTGAVVWQFGVTGVPGSDSIHLNGPHNADRLDSGNTLIADSSNDRILEIDPAGNVVWQYAPAGPGALDWPRDADRLDGGNTLITDSQNDRVLEVTNAGSVVWSCATVASLPYEADRLADGHTLIADSGHGRVVEVDAAGAVVWNYPGTRPTTYRVAWITNPSSGVDLYTHIHLPADASEDQPCPAAALVPGGSGTGQTFHFEAEQLAAEGFVVAHFDPDGRGLSTAGGTYTVEDYCGYLQQDGLKAVLDHLASLPEVDDDNVGILSNSYGITMASGMLARHQDDPPVRYLIDFEGPADRSDTARVNGGHVPVSTSNDLFWREREAATFMPGVLPQYVRLQSASDHNRNITDNHHAIQLINGATNTVFGGDGISIWTRVNLDGVNGPNQIYSVASPPVWFDDVLDDDKQVMQTLALHEMRERATMTVSEPALIGGSADFAADLGTAMASQLLYFALSYGDGPTRITGFTTIHLDADSLLFATLTAFTLDGNGRLALGVPIPGNPALIGSYHAQGVYVHPGAVTGYSATTGVSFEISN